MLNNFKRFSIIKAIQESVLTGTGIPIDFLNIKPQKSKIDIRPIPKKKRVISSD